MGVASLPRTRPQLLILSISILFQEDGRLPLGLKQQLFLVSPFKPVNKLDKGATWTPFYQKPSFCESSDLPKVTQLVNGRTNVEPGLCDLA